MPFLLKIMRNSSSSCWKSTTARVVSQRNHSSASSFYSSNRKEVDIFDGKINYFDDKETNSSESTVVFLHGNPTSSYLWRNVIPHVQPIARCVAPDLIGMGKSSKLPNNEMYLFRDHYKYLEKWFDLIPLPQKINLVVHDWGSVLGFHWANKHRDRIQSITHMESVVKPLKSWDTFPEGGRKIFQAMRSPAGEEIVLKKNVFVERILPTSIIRKLDDEEMAAYLDPFRAPGEDRRPTLTWPREIPHEVEGPADVVEIANANYKFLSESLNIPKLYIHAKPGFFADQILEATKSWPNQKVVSVKGLHFLQEDSPESIGKYIHDFIKDHVLHKSKL